MSSNGLHNGAVSMTLCMIVQLTTFLLGWSMILSDIPSVGCMHPNNSLKLQAQAFSLDLVVCFLWLPKFAVAVGVGRCNHHSTSNNVAQSDRDQILGQERVPGDGCIQIHGHGNDEHVGNGMLKTNGDKGGDGEVDSNSLACQTVGANGHPCCQAHKPVGQDSSQEGLQNAIKSTACTIYANEVYAQLLW